ncbi:hypothetical protein M5K25_027096 [Dendrobium thyrsiflorum]|uniref:PHD-type domain-containing protein n=1 Tax=Dendrobium thyrsiflorum TaxID=117978 RepID=A0ABD0TZB8_DENTH
MQGTDSDDKKFMFPKDRSAMKIESGTCTVCSAPCSLCMHHNRESGISCILSVRTDADSSSVSNVDVMPIYKSRICDDLQPAASEASNLLSSTSSHDSYAENAESKTSLSASAGYDASDDIDMPQVFSVEDRRCAEIDNVECSLVMEGNLNLQPQAEIRRCTEIDNVDRSLASLSGRDSPETKSNPIPNHEVSTSWTKSGFSSGTSNINGLCQDTRSGTDCKKSPDNCSEECHVNDLERDDAVLDAVKGQNQKMQPQASTVGENYESDVALDDVKVCDICGDAGREDYLATCSKCSDGAEHTYCMREMLHKVPEGEWLCEECKTKETEIQNANECEAAYGRLKSTCHNDINQDFMSPLTTRTDLDARGSAKGLQGPHISIRRPVDPLVEGKASELSGASIEAASPGEKLVLFRQISSKNLDMGKMKTARMELSSEAQLAKGSEAFSCSKTYLKSSSFKGLPPLYSPRGRLSRSVSFNNSNVNPKVKTLIENAPPKQKITREPTTNELRKEGLFKTSTKPMFKNITSECSNTDLASKNPLLQRSRTEDLRALKEVKDRNTVEKKNFSVKGKSFIRPSAAITSNYPLKVDAKSVQSDGIRNNVSETSVCRLSEGLTADSLGSNEGKKQISYSSKNIESSSGNYDADNPKGFKVTKEALRRSISSVDGSYRKVEIVSPRRAVQPLESGHKDRRTRDSTIFIGSRLSALGDNRTSHSQRGNETGRTIQDKRGGSAHRTSADQNSREVEKKGNKWREVVNAAMTKSGILKGGKSDTLVELPAISADMICEGASKHTSSAFNQRSLVVENNIGKVSSKDSADVSTKTVAAIGLAQLTVLPVEASGKADGTRDAPNATELSVKSVAKTLLGEASLFTKPGSAVPKLECIWQGSFNVIGTGNHSKMFFGIQAHLSTCASPRVYKLATKVPGNVQLEEVSHISSWPLQLQDENIALFFFAKDAESYDRSYRKLMDKMLRNDLALRGNIEGTELLIFTSNKLPMNSQRWNRMHYLWGMFRGKRRYYLPVMGDQKKPLLSNQDFFVPPIADVVSNVQSLETSSKLKKLSDFISSKVVHGEHTNGVDLPPISSIIEDKTRKTLEVSPVQNLLNEVHAVPKVTQEKPSFSVSSSSGTKAEPLRVTSDYPNSRLQMTTTKSCSEEKNNVTYQEKFVSDCTNKKAGNSSALTYEIGVESSLRRAPSVPSVSPNCNEGADCINIEENSGEKETSPSVRAIIDDDQRGNVLGADLLGCESTANRKRERSCSTERMSQPSGEMSKNTIETVLLRDGPSWFPVEDESEQKKTCYNSGSIDINDSTSARLSSKVHPLFSSIMRQEQPVESLCNETLKPQNIRNTERCFFQIDLGPVQNAKCTNIIHIPSKEEDALESSSPDLELALGGKSKSTKLFSFPSLFHSVDGGKQQWQPGSPGDGDDASASLSLSL